MNLLLVLSTTLPLLLLLLLLLPEVTGNCCMPKRFKATTYDTESVLGDVHVYVDFPQKKITIIPDSTKTGMMGLVVDYGTGHLYRHFVQNDYCTKSPFNGLEGLEQCIPKTAHGVSKTEELWSYTLTSGMNVTIGIEKKMCFPFFFELSKATSQGEGEGHADWTEGVVWEGFFKEQVYDVPSLYVRTTGCTEDDGTIIG